MLDNMYSLTFPDITCHEETGWDPRTDNLELNLLSARPIYLLAKTKVSLEICWFVFILFEMSLFPFCFWTASHPLSLCLYLHSPAELSLHLHLSFGLADHLGTTGDFTTNSLRSSQFSAFGCMMFHLGPVHSLMLSSHRFLGLPLRLPPCTVSCRTVLVSPDDCVTRRPDDCVTRRYHLSLCLFTEVRRSSYGLMVFSILVLTSLLVKWSLYKLPRSLQKPLISITCILLYTPWKSWRAIFSDRGVLLYKRTGNLLFGVFSECSSFLPSFINETWPK